MKVSGSALFLGFIATVAANTFQVRDVKMNFGKEVAPNAWSFKIIKVSGNVHVADCFLKAGGQPQCKATANKAPVTFTTGEVDFVTNSAAPGQYRYTFSVWKDDVEYAGVTVSPVCNRPKPCNAAGPYPLNWVRVGPGN